MIELSVLCDLKIFMLLQDDSNKRSTHFSSHKDFDFVQCFNQLNQREFYTNRDYERVGGTIEELDSDYRLTESELSADFAEIDEEFQKLQNNMKQIKIFSIKRKDLLCTSRIGNLREQMRPLPAQTM